MAILRLLVVCLLGAATALGATDPYNRIVDEMRNLESKNPDLVSVFTLGKNDDGIDILAMRISNSPTASDPSKLAHLVVSTHHGDEKAAPLLAMHFANSLVSQYKGPHLFLGRLPDTEWIIVPVLNISGYNAGLRNEYRLDPNRQYPGPCKSSGPSLASIKVLMDFLESRTFVATATLHGYMGVLAYPWGMATTDSRTRDESLFVDLFRDAASFNRYTAGNSADAIYPADGTYEDYAYWKHGVWSMLVELLDGTTKDIANTTDALFNFFEQVNSSPSTLHDHTGKCSTYSITDLHLE